MNKILSAALPTFTLSIFSQESKKVNPIDFVPKNYNLVEEIYGDLNKDGIDDCVLIIKGTDKNKFISTESGEKLDRNRRGIIVLFKNDLNYEIAVKNYKCFASENEEGGNYFAPEFSAEIKKGNLYFNYGHGRYGFWKYTFRYKNSDFELIGFDRSNGGVVIESETSINFLTKMKHEKVNTNENADGGDEIFTKTKSKIKINKLIKLSEIIDIDELDMSVY